MKSSRFIFPLLFFIAAADVAGQVAKVTGQGEGYAGKKIEVFLISDPVSERLNPVTVVKCDPEGKFSLEIPAGMGYRTLCLKSSVYLFKLLVAAGKEYMISLPPFVPLNPEEAGNPFFSPATVVPFVVNDSTDVNNLTGEFDLKYNEVMTRVAERVANKTRQDEIPALMESLNPLTGLSDNEFYRDYVTYRIIMLNAVAYGEYPGRKEDSVMINKKFCPENPAYTDLVNHLFSDYFRVLLAGPGAAQLMNAIKTCSLDECGEILLKNGKIVNRELQHYVILLNIYYGYYKGLLDIGTLNAMLETVTREGATDYIKELAAKLKENVFRMKKNTFPPQFSLPDTSGKIITPSDFRGKYLLLVFIGDAGMETLSELSLLKSWYEKYRDNLSLALIVTGEDFKKRVSFFRQRGYRWNFLDASGSPFIASQYEIRSYPGFVLVGPDGRIADDYCPLPSEGLEGFFARLAGLR